MLQAEPDIRIMNIMGYEAMTVGNHEFDLKFTNLLKQQSLANFPYLSANIFYRRTKNPVFNRFKVFRKKGIKIAVFGITTHETPYVSSNGNNKELIFEKPEKIIPEMVKKLKGKVDLLICLIHEHYPRVRELARKYPGVDIMIGGHTHYPADTFEKVGETFIVEAGAYGMTMGKIDLTFKNKKLVAHKYKLIGINLTKPLLDEKGKVLCKPYHKRFAQDPQIEAFLKPYIEKTQKLLDQSIGEAGEDIVKDIPKLPQISPMGNLIADAIKAYAKTQIAFQNKGGVRTSLLQGKITYRIIKSILPFTNSIVTYRIKGSQLYQLLEVMAKKGRLTPGCFYVSGITFEVKTGKPFNIKVAGKKLDMKQTYSMAINSFIAGGGDGYSIFKTFPKKVDTGFHISSALRNYIENNSPVTAKKEQRIIWHE